MKNSLMLAIIGMPGSGKTEAVSYIETKGIACIRFGLITEEGLAKENLPVTAENEKNFREKLRHDLGMAAYAMQSKSKIDELFSKNKIIAIDGLYSWEEYIFLKQFYPNLILITIFAEAKKRYERLAGRSIRPFSNEDARERDIAEIEKLNKGGPIAIADYFIENNTDSKDHLYDQIDTLLTRLQQSND